MLTKFTGNVENHQSLDNNPSDDSGFESRAARAQALKVLFDKGAVDIKNFINETLIPEIEAGYIASIARTSGTGEAGTTDTYTITYQDASTDTFTIYNGSDGAKGDPGLTGDTGPTGPAGRSINSITRTNGDGSAGTTDTYTITFSDSSTPIEFTIYNGADGEGLGDMLKSTYDTDADGSVDKADAIDGIASAGNSKYYGTDSTGASGFHDIPSGGTSFDIHALTTESTLADTDEMPFYDVSASATRKTLWSNIKTVLKTYFDTLYAAASHSHSYMPLSGGTFTGQAVAQSNTSYTTAQIRNVILSTSDPTGGNNGDIWIKYT